MERSLGNEGEKQSGAYYGDHTPSSQAVVAGNCGQDESDRDEDAEYHQRQYRPPVGRLLEELGRVYVDGSVGDGEAIKEWRHYHQGQRQAEEFAPVFIHEGKEAGGQFAKEEPGRQQDGDQDDAVKNHTEDVALEKLGPFILFRRRFAGELVLPGVDPRQNVCRKPDGQPAADGIPRLYHIRSRKRSDDGDGDDYRIDEVPHDAEAAPKAGDDE